MLESTDSAWAIDTGTDEAGDGVDRRDFSWYKDAVIYQLHIKAFRDANGDGIGDFQGLLQKLDYVQQLGVNTIWLLPFYPSPLKDDGYDIADYTAVNSSYGTLTDFKALVAAAHARGIRVITELVINHTSDQHPWFQRARRALPGTPEREFYVWSDTEDRYRGTRIIFIDTESSNWTWDPVAKAYFWHRFYSHQPDLNFENPAVFAEVVKALRFWLDIGVDGLRLDAVPYLCEREGTSSENLPETHEVLRRIRSEIDARYPDRMLLAEANQWPEDTRAYFGDGDECHMAFHFPLMPRMYMALAQEDRHPITDIMRQTPEVPESCQWALFLRNHDELTLEMVTDEERDYLWRTYAADPRARLNLGIRRRLSALMDNDRRKIELMNALLLSMPGTPVIYYGDEIGMGDNYYLGDRDGVRTPMQWSIDRNAGFSNADPQRLYLPVLMDPIYGYQAVNVESQDKDPSSLLNWMRRMIAIRKGHRAFGRGSLTFLYPRNRRVLAYLREHEGQRILCAANLSRSAQAVELDLGNFRGLTPLELGGRSVFPTITSSPYVLTLPAYGFFWFVLCEEADVVNGPAAAPEPLPELVTLVLANGGGSSSALQARERRYLTESVLPSFLPRQRWFGDKNQAITSVSMEPLGALDAESNHVLVAVRARQGEGEKRYFLPLAVNWDLQDAAQLPYTIARVRRGARLGILMDAVHDAGFALAFLAKLQASAVVTGSEGEVVFEGTPTLAALDPPKTVKDIGAEQSNASLIIGDALMLKFYRRLMPGIHPDVEITRFLTEVAGFPNTPAYLGSVRHNAADGTSTTLAVAFRFVQNQGDAWGAVTDALDRLLEGYRLAEGASDDALSAFPLDIGGKIGRRTAEMHRALLTHARDPAFEPEAIAAADIKRWSDDLHTTLEETFHALDGLSADSLGEQAKNHLQAFRQKRPQMEALVGNFESLAPSGAKCRIHGDYHLGQLLMVKDDVFIVDFEGEPRRSMDERRAKTSPLRDVAGMLRSFDYAAWAALDKLAQRGVQLTEERQALAFRWRAAAAKVFLTEYMALAKPTPAYPRDEVSARGQLSLFLLQKALYEVQYEVGSRPAWVSIALRGVLDLLQQIGGEV
ncbi:MAG: maltose alpha-D-glucosyltransferase [Hyphomicrobiales bacterium]|nr:MAG: maltose alpha-D-glucosyltransferase [Hyphomicrobiales bacterium]